MIQKTGPGAYIDHGPQRPYRGARSVVGGCGLGNAVVTGPRVGDMRASSQHVRRERTTPSDPHLRWTAWMQLHSTCDCHVMYGGSPRTREAVERYRSQKRERRASGEWKG